MPQARCGPSEDAANSLEGSDLHRDQGTARFFKCSGVWLSPDGALLRGRSGAPIDSPAGRMLAAACAFSGSARPDFQAQETDREESRNAQMQPLQSGRLAAQVSVRSEELNSSDSFHGVLRLQLKSPEDKFLQAASRELRAWPTWLQSTRP